MIFAAVGTQLPFDRMIRCVDEWANTHKVEVVGQIGESDYQPIAMKVYRFLSPSDFSIIQAKADVLVGHAGMGTILGAMELGKPLIILPRLASYKEHRNDHQLATAKKFLGFSGIYVAFNEAELSNFLCNYKILTLPDSRISKFASKDLLSAVDAFIGK